MLTFSSIFTSNICIMQKLFVQRTLQELHEHDKWYDAWRFHRSKIQDERDAFKREKTILTKWAKEVGAYKFFWLFQKDRHIRLKEYTCGFFFSKAFDAAKQAARAEEERKLEVERFECMRLETQQRLEDIRTVKDVEAFKKQQEEDKKLR